MTPMHVLAGEVGVSERTLRRAVNLGTLRATRMSPRRLRLPLTEWQYTRRTWPLLSALRLALRTEHNVRFALLFGSVATGRDSPESDIDLLVELHDSSLDRVVDLEVKLSRITGRRVEIVRLEDARDEPSFLGEVLAEGRVLVDRGHIWPGLQGRAAALAESGHRDEVRRARGALAGIDRLVRSSRA